MNTFNTFRALDERTMTAKEKAKEDRLKDKYDDSSMKKNMKDHYGKEEGEKVYYATIRKQAMKNEHHQKDADGKVIEHEDEAPGTPASVEEAALPAGQVPDKRAEALKKRQSMIKKQVLMKKLQALRQGGGEDVVAHNELEGEMVEGVGDAIKKGVKRHKDAVEKKKIKNRKAVPYAALAAEHELEGEELKEYSPNVTYQAKGGKKSGKLGKSSVYSLRDKDESKKDFRKSHVKDIKGGYLKAEEYTVTNADKKGNTPAWKDYKAGKKNVKTGKPLYKKADHVEEDYMSGQTGKIQKRTLAWMRKKGMKGAPGLDAMKAREAEHKARRGVKEETGCETKKIENKGKKKIDPNKNPVVEGSAYGLWKGDGKRKLPGDKKKKQDVKEAKVDKGRSDYGKATIRNWRHSGPSTVEPAMFDPENKRGKTIEKRREEHKARRGVKGAKVPTYKKESFSDWRTDLGEEGYDRWRDDRLVKYGIGHDGSDRKGSTSRPTGKKPKGKTVYQKEAEKKYGKGATALDIVKAKIRAKHGAGAIMDTKKPKK